MGWLWTSELSASESDPEPQQPTPTSMPTRTAAPPTSSDAAAFNAAHPHLAPSTPQEPSTSTSTSTSTPHDPSLPTTMSCRAAFDSAFYCTSLGGHFNDIYRYGSLRSCSEHWADWRFCMSLKSYSSEAQANAVQDLYREKERKMKEKPNSENVWRKRGAGEEIVRPFGKAEEEVRRVQGNGL